MNSSQVARAIVFNLKRAESAYKKYLADGRKFIYAKSIKNANRELIDLIGSYNYLTPKVLENEMLQLLEHLEIWKERWKECYQALNPDLDQEFVFENPHQFPRQACQTIISYFESNL